MKRFGVIAVVVVALLFGAGAATATSQWIITSTKQIKPTVLRKLHGARGPRGFRGLVGATGATGAKGASGARGATGATGPKGSPGATGATGPRGATGATGATGAAGSVSVQTVTGPTATLNPSADGASLASCPTGTSVVSGGWIGGTQPPTNAGVSDSDPVNGTGWDVVMHNNGSATVSFAAVAVCTK
jgi:hypothetical protein